MSYEESKKVVSPHSRAQPDITSGPEVRQIVKIRTVRKPDIFLPGRRTFENRKKIKKIKLQFFFFKFFFQIFFKNFFYEYLYGKMFKNISPDSVRSVRTCPANLGVQSCPVKKLICPVRSSPTPPGRDRINVPENLGN